MAKEQPAWLHEYYGTDFDLLNPELVTDGENFALVKLMKTVRVPKKYSNIGWVIIRKNGRHSLTPHTSVHEGTATEEDHKKMVETLKKADSES